MLATSPTGSLLAADASSAPADRKTVVVRADPRTGKLVRSVIVSAPKTAAQNPSKAIGEMVDKAARAQRGSSAGAFDDPGGEQLQPERGFAQGRRRVDAVDAADGADAGRERQFRSGRRISKRA